MLFVEMVADDVFRKIGDLGAAQVFADGDEFHLGRDDALAGVVELSHRLAGAPEGLAACGGEAGEFDELIGALGLLEKYIICLINLVDTLLQERIQLIKQYLIFLMVLI